MAAAASAAENNLSVENLAEQTDPFAIMPNPASDLFKAAMFLQSDIMGLKNKMPFPPSPENVSENIINLPNSLYNFLAWVLVGDDSEQEDALSLSCVKLSLMLLTDMPFLLDKI